MSTSVRIRAARSQDIAACASILNEWIDETDWMPRVHTREAVEQFYRDVVFQERKLFVAEMEGKISGLMALTSDAMVSALYVGRTFRRRGIGSHLVNRAKRELGDVVSLWTFQANTGAQTFYSAHGFREINRTDGDNEEGLPDILMEWQAE
jgi:ribosomal protein S18 acetylase RimI-like enzyme